MNNVAQTKKGATSVLVISRCCEESFWVGDTEIIILKISSQKVLIGIDAPSHLKIIRSELIDDADEDDD